MSMTKRGLLASLAGLFGMMSGGASSSRTGVSVSSSDADRRERFREAVSASLRTNPGVIMIGQIRDPASYSLAMEAANAGRTVWIDGDDPASAVPFVCMRPVA